MADIVKIDSKQLAAEIEAVEKSLSKTKQNLAKLNPTDPEVIDMRRRYEELTGSWAYRIIKPIMELLGIDTSSMGIAWAPILVGIGLVSIPATVWGYFQALKARAGLLERESSIKYLSVKVVPYIGIGAGLLGGAWLLKKVTK